MESPRDRTDEELVKASYHVWYEHELLKYCSERLRPDVRPAGRPFSVLMESFLIHARNLNLFFYSMERKLQKCGGFREDDIIVEDFFAGYAPWEKPQEYRIPEKELKRINTQLAHLSYKREFSEQHSWDFEDICDRLTTVFELFVTAAPKSRLCPEILGGRPRPLYLGIPIQ